MKIRRLIEIAARGRTFKRRMPHPFTSATIIVSPDSQLKYLKPGRDGFDPMLLDVAEDQIKEGMVVWDIGANVGVFSVAAATLGASVLAFEADPWLAQLLKRTQGLAENVNLDLNTVAAAISNRDGIAQLLVAKRGRASNALEQVGGHGQMGGIRERTIVPSLRLDTVYKSMAPPDFIKIDVEGAELLVLKGAKALLQRQPGLLIEVSATHRESISSLLKDSGYRLYNAERVADSGEEIELCMENTLALADS